MTIERIAILMVAILSVLHQTYRIARRRGYAQGWLDGTGNALATFDKQMGRFKSPVTKQDKK